MDKCMILHNVIVLSAMHCVHIHNIQIIIIVTSNYTDIFL